MPPIDSAAVASRLSAELARSSTGSKRLKLRTLLAKFGYTKRSDRNTAEITRLLSGAGLALNPPIVRLGDEWEISLEDWIYVSASDDPPARPQPAEAPVSWNADGWFDRIATMELRTEKEVEIKFIVPLLARLGYTDEDRYDEMPVPAAHGSRNTTLVIDFALFNAALESLRNQPLLTVEAKRESRLATPRELLSAHNQAKSYCLWTQCEFFMVTDSRTLQVFHIARGRLGSLAPLLVCDRQELATRFGELYALVSKPTLTRFHLAKLTTVEEVV